MEDPLKNSITLAARRKIWTPL